MTVKTFEISSDYGFVLLTILASFVMTQWLMIRVSMARLKYDVKLPKMYTEPFTHVFNCIQRVHHNTLEMYQIYLIFLTFGGIYYPKLSAAVGVWWIISRVIYALDYSTGDPEKRKVGAWLSFLSLYFLAGINIISALSLLGVV